jgi:hypothetical protein
MSNLKRLARLEFIASLTLLAIATCMAVFRAVSLSFVSQANAAPQANTAALYFATTIVLGALAVIISAPLYFLLLSHRTVKLQSAIGIGAAPGLAWFALSVSWGVRAVVFGAIIMGTTHVVLNRQRGP